MKTLGNTSEFIAVYNELDSYMRKRLGAVEYVDHGTLLRQMSDKNRLFSDNYKDLRLFADLRNILVHNPYPDKASPLIVPHQYILSKYQEIRDAVLHPKKAIDIAIKASFIYTTTLDANSIDVMEEMDEKTYTHVPVMEGQHMIGVFSENCILAYIVHHKEAIIMKDTKIEEFKDFIEVNKHKSEYFEFVQKDTLLSDVELMFQERLKARKRIAVVYITEHGKQNERLLGMITAWDIAGKS
jgi:predicted transcriptional regulator